MPTLAKMIPYLRIENLKTIPYSMHGSYLNGAHISRQPPPHPLPTGPELAMELTVLSRDPLYHVEKRKISWRD